jgi:hypothetical protein
LSTPSLPLSEPLLALDPDVSITFQIIRVSHHQHLYKGRRLYGVPQKMSSNPDEKVFVAVQHTVSVNNHGVAKAYLGHVNPP